MKAAHPEVVAATRVNPGETLRQGRESKNWSLPDVASRLNLTVAFLGNVETGDFEKLPGHTFARGYIRAYAKLLGLDQTALVQQFDHYTGTDSHGSNVHSLGRIEEPVRLSHNILRIVSLLLLVVLVGGGFFWWQDQASMRGKELVNTNLEHVEVESADGTTQIHPLDGPEDQVVADSQGTTSTLALPAGTQAAEVAPAAPATSVVAPSASVTAAPVHVVPVTPATTVSPTPATTMPVTTSGVQPTPEAGAGLLNMRYVADCWTQVTDGNGKVLLSGVKRKGENLDVSGKPPFSVRLGFARGVQLTYNGQAVDLAPFSSGETARLKLGQ
ncbi:helix-turn-helix domain-containing protein [Pseudomonas sp. 10B1]|uniref:RodZ family helix-turn-helix domain-containing protein n=1 Tax=unclassified Pseudomonas TaxID=196821 RepID=UPI002AB485AE|nr:MULTISPECIES: RodZ family helix-turn-helix domain-containing protein [unclassified Pseudomonas]MDY7559231.1 helix-turn-helix domain-containing protein [Pseudomonas sp. AB6]MEA9977758.1 helix-turn-helix domain-containing protein [Pseudomonas sp. RTS4]MEA9994175.1 helix-turn-helix domain-containing protein [Pseudomonas sp. AA4]MEB0086190.1 helix-turn-helix domain-containing protein [Pseudomonas sp. RTI1]MEB0124978.1 helix-turn-helix domain-containing protein [Pseudomonas sp. CCC1.2]